MEVRSQIILFGNDFMACAWIFHQTLPSFGIGMKTDLFQSCGHCRVFQICWHIECSTSTASSFRIWNSSTGIPPPPLVLFIWCFLRPTSEKVMATHSSTLAWKIPRTKEPGRLQSMGSLRVGHNWATSLSLFTFMHWRRKWQPTPVFLPAESQGRRSLVGCHFWGRTESDTTEVT